MIFDTDQNGDEFKVNNTRHVLFGQGGIVAGMRGNKDDGFVKIDMWELEKPIRTGAEVDRDVEVKNDMAGIVLAFKSVESIDVVIGWLEDAKRLIVGKILVNSHLNDLETE
jgi:hypothetical protein